MGRGRQKAKHTKVARELKYFSPNTNYGALEKELTGAEAHSGEWPEYEAPEPEAEQDSEYIDVYAVDDDEEEDVPERKGA
jgi:hypothetical protein